MIYILHFKYGPIDLYGESGRLWIPYAVFNPGKAYATVLCNKSVGSNPTYIGYALTMHAMGTFSQVARGAKSFWARYFSGPKKAMHFWKVHYLAFIT